MRCERTRFATKRIGTLIILVFASVWLASANTIYNVSGTFAPSGSSNPDSGPLNGGTFTGTFFATLPITSATESITTFDVNLMNSSSTILLTLSSSIPGDFARAGFEAGDCATGPSIRSACDFFLFSNASGTDSLQLITSLDFTAGAVFSGFIIASASSSEATDGGNLSSNASLVASGTRACG